MFNHMALFLFNEGRTEEQIDVVTAALDALPDQIAVLAGYRFGRGAGITDGSWDYPVVAEAARVQFET